MGRFFLLLAACQIQLEARSAPNLIAIVTDDQAPWSLGAYGNRECRTPNLDQLAHDGARFLNAFVATPVCSPSRATYLTGRWGTELGITDWISVPEAKRGAGLPAGSMTWPRVLQRKGYVTGLAGKWHLGVQSQFHPRQFGFDYFFGALKGSFEPRNPKLESNGVEQAVAGFSADVIVDDALRFLERNKARPFALLIHFREPHLPYGPVAEEDSAPFRALDPAVPAFEGLHTNKTRNWIREYYGAVHAVDRNVGRVLAWLEEAKLAGRTIVTFTSDHGYAIGQHGLHGKGNAPWVVGGRNGPTRPNMFEESIRTPLLIRWPGVIRPGTVFPELVSNLDTYPTVLGLLGITPPRSWKQHGLDFSPLLRGEPFEARKVIFAQYDIHHTALDHLRMIRTPEWKLVRHFGTDGLDELYHLASDPGEMTNLFGEERVREAQETLQRQLTAWQKSIRDPLAPKER